MQSLCVSIAHEVMQDMMKLDPQKNMKEMWIGGHLEPQKNVKKMWIGGHLERDRETLIKLWNNTSSEIFIQKRSDSVGFVHRIWIGM